jgi:hypothetical protein
MFHYYTLTKLLKNEVPHINKYIIEIVQVFLQQYESATNYLYIVQHSYNFIEKNEDLLKYRDLMLYTHQKDIFVQIKAPEPKLILNIAPTGTGKTLTPIGISQGYKVIFVCAARHVGLALARAAISIGKHIAFAFGCSAAEDVRLHFSAAKEYTKDRRSGQIRKVDNTIGDKVEIMICDIRSYLPAMYYMASFFDTANIVTYWDEPTITMDYNEHELHSVIRKNWIDNVIPNFVLSSATLPKQTELTNVIASFCEKFPQAIIGNIVSHDCRKTIPLINNNGYVVVPHTMYSDYNDILRLVAHYEDHLCLLRYMDLREVSDFIHYVVTNKYLNNKKTAAFDYQFESVDAIDMESVKMYYLKLLKNITPGSWQIIYNHFMATRQKRIVSNNTIDPKGNAIVRTRSLDLSKTQTTSASIVRLNSDSAVLGSTNVDGNGNGNCGIYVSTKDAYTLTDGPTIFLANDLEKIAKFCIQQANIPASLMKDITDKIEWNNEINNRIYELQKVLEFEELKLGGTNGENSKKSGSDKLIEKTTNHSILKMREDISILEEMIKFAALDDLFIPNRLAHLNKWANGLNTSHAFTSHINESTINSIMLLKDVANSWKVLLLLGIGVFTNHESIAYTEIMKKMADQQRLYLIIADSDYIYGTNYQFCHCYISKDMDTLTQEKIIQAMGRVGRNNIQQNYSIRFRDDAQIHTLFATLSSEEKPEVINMNLLLGMQN